jgi:ribose 5-phosphate isomerase B
MLVIGADHGGYTLKEEIIKHLKKRGLAFKDFGTFSDEAIDYPTIAVPVAKAVSEGEFERAILVCGTGIGMSIAANKFKGIRAAVCGDTFSTRFTRLHNDANILCLGARVTGGGLAIDIVDLFLDTPFEGGKHLKRINLISEIEKI